MTETSILPWIEVNEMMDDEYRQRVVADALSYLPKASPELSKFALAVFKSVIHVNGFRSFQSIPQPMVKIQVVKEFKVNDLIAEAAICLWAEKQREIIETLAKAARKANIPVPAEWGWEDGRYGFVQSESPLEIEKLASALSAEKTKPESDHYILAGLWLSRSLLVEEPQE